MKRWRVTLAVIVLPVVIHGYMYLMFSHKRAYDQIKLGELQDEVRSVLSREAVTCCVDAFVPRASATSSSSKCFFDDPWREYTVTFTDNRVASKGITYPRPRPMLLRIFQLIRH